MTQLSKAFKSFNNFTSLQKSLIVAILSVLLFASSSAVAYSLFSGVKGSLNKGGDSLVNNTLPGTTAGVAEDPTQPRTQECPLDGTMHTQQAKDAWTSKRPLAVMIENHLDARPQSGLSSADIVYEAVAEGGITRFMGVFLCTFGDVQVGPVRSARTYFIDWLSEYNPLYAHVGGANSDGPANALGQIIKYGIKDLNQFSIGFPTYWRDYNRLGHPVATEHTMYSTTQKLWDIGAKRGWAAIDDLGKHWDATFVAWKFKDPAPVSGTTDTTLNSATKIDVSFWSGYGDYAVNWEYDGTCSCYKRKNAGVPHLDMDTNKQLTTNNVVIQFERESHANDGYENNAHLLYKTIGTGKALIFQDGKVIEGTWNKADRLSRSKYLDSKGKEIAFNRGPIWIETVPEGAEVKY